MICHSTIRAAVTSAVVFALITTTICCSGEEDSRQKEQKDLMTGVGSGQRIYIRDPQLSSLVRQAVGTEGEFVTDTQIAMLQELIAVPHFTLESGADPDPIRDLEGLEFATGLTHLDLSGHHLIDDITLFNFDSYDYSPLDTLDIEIIYAISAIYHKNLVQFTANISDVDDFTPLAGLTNLRHLYLDECDIDLRWGNENLLAPLAELTNLETLHLNNNGIYDITPLAGLTNLRYLDLSGCGIGDLTPLAGLTNLRHLYLGGEDRNRSRIDDLTPLAKLTNLEELFLYIKDSVDVLPLCALKMTTIRGVELNCK